MNCERCEERHDRIRLGTMDEYNIHGPYCADCWDAEAESAHERSLSDYYGGSGPVTVQEHYDAAVQERADIRRRD